ncbi:hypothetical protein HAX54_052789, partial [Datura stramonium]|nr:hypothetical protein [Datura stramonium]
MRSVENCKSAAMFFTLTVWIFGYSLTGRAHFAEGKSPIIFPGDKMKAEGSGMGKPEGD